MAQVVIFCDYYLPGFRAGGPIQSIHGIIASEPHQVRVLTRNRDMQDPEPYPGIQPGVWTTRSEGQVLYLDQSFARWWRMLHDLRSQKIDVLYLNSLHSIAFALFPLLCLRLGIFSPRMVLIAPRGECSEGAQAKKGLKKRLARKPMRWLVKPKCIWHVSSEIEKDDVIRWLGGALPSSHAILIRANPSPVPADLPLIKAVDNSVPVISFVSRIDPMKGLDEAISVLSETTRRSVFRIHGTVSSESYWQRCQSLLATLPESIQVQVRGPFAPKDLREILNTSDLLILPTHGENFGHVIAAALANGCPVALSDHTMWSSVARGGGGIATNDHHAMTVFIDNFLALTSQERFRIRESTAAAYHRWYWDNLESGSLFTEAMNRSGVDSGGRS